MHLRPGIRLASAACDVQVVVVRAPAGTDVDLRCGGAPMRDISADGERLPITFVGEAAQLGKRYADESIELELLCTRAGEGALSVGESPLFVKGAKPLPASD